MKKNKCKICRRLGTKLFLKGEKCLSPKCPMIKRPYPPGPKGKRRRRSSSEYAKELAEKQKLRNCYNLKEYQLKSYVRGVLGKRGGVEDAQDLLIRKLEKRLDNVIFRLGFASSISQARQLVSHGHFLVNGRKVNIPSYQVKKGDKINASPIFQKKTMFQALPSLLKKHQPPSWLKLNIKNLEGEVVDQPSVEGVLPPAEISVIFEFYSR